MNTNDTTPTARDSGLGLDDGESQDDIKQPDGESQTKQSQKTEDPETKAPKTRRKKRDPEALTEVACEGDGADGYKLVQTTVDGATRKPRQTDALLPRCPLCSDPLNDKKIEKPVAVLCPVRRTKGPTRYHYCPTDGCQFSTKRMSAQGRKLLLGGGVRQRETFVERP